MTTDRSAPVHGLTSELQLALYAAIIESSHDAISSYDHEGIINSWNPTAERMFGYAANEIIGQLFTCLIPPAFAEESEAMAAKILSGQQVDTFETFRMKKDGTIIPISQRLQ